MSDLRAGAESLVVLDPVREADLLAAEEEEAGEAGFLSYRQLVWRRFRRSRMGVIGGVALILLYLAVLFADFFAPFSYQHDNVRLRYVPPQRLHLSVFPPGAFVYGLKPTRDPETLEIHYTPDPTRRHAVRAFYPGDPYRLLGLIPCRTRLVGSDGPFFLLGTDRMGRDILSRILYGGRVSLTVGLVGVFLSLILGSILGTASGYWGGAADVAIQRLIELLSAFPAVPLWMALAAALPSAWSSIQVYLAITVILSLLSWGGLARQVRGKILAVREADFVMAARSAGAGHWYLLTRHLLPTAYSHIIVIATLSVPGMILGETALSFLGLGIRPPMTSWGVLLQEAQRVTVVLHYPWLLVPALPVILTVVAYNFVGDALRDAADPYST